MAIIGGTCGALRAGSHFDISISTSINISIRKVRKICVNPGYISISVSISIRIIRRWKKENGKKFHSLFESFRNSLIIRKKKQKKKWLNECPHI